MRKPLLVIPLLFAAIIAPNARANVVTFTTVTGSDSDGPLAAMIAFNSVTGGLEITITNTESGTLAKGQAVSDLSFTVGNGLSTPTFFTQLMGKSFNPVSGGAWTISSGTSFNDTSSSPPINAIDHWGFSPSGATVLLATTNSPVPAAGNPHYMILPSSGTAGPGASLDNSNFDPYIIGPASFFLTVPGGTATTDLTGDISNVNVSFGTGPDKILGTTENVPPVPEPKTMLLFGSGLLFIFIVSRKVLFAESIQNRPITNASTP